jgi:TatD DNase family protein
MIDTHCHIDRYANPQQIAQEAEHLGITTIAVTTLPVYFEQSFSLFRSYKRVRLALGLHPLESGSHTAVQQQKFINLLAKTSYIGEIGLDFSQAGRATMEKQIESLRFVLNHVRDRPRFITIHSRNAEGKVFELLEEYTIPNVAFHWYSGPLGVLDKIIRAGYYLSINPAMVVSKKGQNIIAQIPRERALTETDGPYVKIGSKPAQPPDVQVVIAFLSRLWKINQPEVVQQVYANFNNILDPIRRTWEK